MTEQTNTSVQLLVDEAEIVRVVDGIDDAVDAKDWEVCRAYFADEIYVDFTSLAGGEPERIPADNLVDAWRTNLYTDKPSFHMRTNHRISVDEDRAEVSSKAHALNILLRDRGSDLWETWGHYVHTLERAESGWVCTGMTYSVAYAQGNEMVREYVPKGEN